MIPTRAHRGWVIALTLLAAFVLTLFPLPAWASLLRPEWVMLALIYWCLALPDRIGIGAAWGMGLLLDAASGTLLGQHALAFALVAYITLKLYARIRRSPLWQQALIVLALVFIEQMLVLWITGIIGQLPWRWGYLLPTFTSMLVWPAVFLVLRHVRRTLRVT
ncbi:MAG: rod shape-determining protein MreD [Gammaproteobacteria bacterium]|nr:rod shape-determining protein MreD [Gammaproteobacteria bacterium]